MTIILVVDDDPAVLLNTCAYLEDEGYEVILAKCAQEALSMVEQKQPQIGIIDMRLPDMDGNELILKSHASNPQMQFIIHTGSSDYVLPNSLIDIGINKQQIVNKPVADMNIFINVIADLVREQE
jgi:two-component system, OmpR family, response regulator